MLMTTRVCGCCKRPHVRLLLRSEGEGVESRTGRGAVYIHYAPHAASVLLADGCPFACASRTNRTASVMSFSTPLP